MERMFLLRRSVQAGREEFEGGGEGGGGRGGGREGGREGGEEPLTINKSSQLPLMGHKLHPQT